MELKFDFIEMIFNHRIFLGILILFIWDTNMVMAVKNQDDISSENRFNFVAAGDWGCGSKAQDTVRNMQVKNPELVLALGDLSFQKGADCWINLIKPLEQKLKIILGDHDIDENNLTRYNQYLDYFNMTEPYYSFDYRKVHFLGMATAKNDIIPYDNSSLQFKFIEEDLKKAQNNKDINWIIVYTFRTLYSSNTMHPGTDELRNNYHPLFDKYGVDLVLQAHNHNYQRTFPLKYNQLLPTDPVASDKNTKDYDAGDVGPIFLTVGTAGRDLYNFTGQKPFIVSQFERHGFLNVEINDDGKNLTATFYENREGKSKDQFTLKKNFPS